MAWEISMTRDGWENVSINLLYLAHHSPGTLIEGIASHVLWSGDIDPETGDHEGFNESKYWRAVALLKGYAELELADEALRLIELNNTCTNGGYEVYLDDQGYVTIPVELLPGAEKYGLDY